MKQSNATTIGLCVAATLGIGAAVYVVAGSCDPLSGVAGGVNTCSGGTQSGCKAPPVLSYGEPSLRGNGGGDATGATMDVNRAYAVDMAYKNASAGREAEDSVFRAATMMKPNVHEHTNFMASNKVDNWAPGVADLPQKIQEANMHMAVLRRPISDGVHNRSPILLYHPPPPRELPREKPALLELGFGISERLQTAYMQKDDDLSDQYVFMPTEAATNKWTGTDFNQVQPSGGFR